MRIKSKHTYCKKCKQEIVYVDNDTLTETNMYLDQIEISHYVLCPKCKSKLYIGHCGIL